MKTTNKELKIATEVIENFKDLVSNEGIGRIIEFPEDTECTNDPEIVLDFLKACALLGKEYLDWKEYK